MSQASTSALDGPPKLRLGFDGGTLLIDGLPDGDTLGLPGVRFDARSQSHRAEAIWYRAIVEHLRRQQVAYVDEARDYEKTSWSIRIEKAAFPHQTEGLDAWWSAGGRGVVVLPTGTGKTHLANLAIARAGRPTLVVTPTIDLLNQWYDELTLCFETEVGLLGGGLLRHPAPDGDDV